MGSELNYEQEAQVIAGIHRRFRAELSMREAASLVIAVQELSKLTKQAAVTEAMVGIEPAAWGVREGIGETLWFFSTNRQQAEGECGYKDAAEPLYTEAQMSAALLAAIGAEGQPDPQEGR